MEAGKVKLATHNVTGKKVIRDSVLPTCPNRFLFSSSQLAVKILRRTNISSPPTNLPADAAKQASKEKEIRTLREAAVSMFLHHPYICDMREIIIRQYHYYVFFEYVNGDQMLDYIMSHGCLQERTARKFARQIGSALSYCHQNNVVHRGEYLIYPSPFTPDLGLSAPDLKIENILISQTRHIKIVGLGLSNPYNPVNNLSTSCGSSYFAAPELLDAKPYIDPEVYVWSFGVVLYVLVCGKVPFGDPSMSALHAKVKGGLVEYPVCLSPGMLSPYSAFDDWHSFRSRVQTPSFPHAHDGSALRAPLAEALSHPWMILGFNGPLDPHMLHREPLHADELDREVIRGMAGLEFGSEQDIENQLVAILESEEYVRAVQHWEGIRSIGGYPNGHGREDTRWRDLSNPNLPSGGGASGRGDPPTPFKKSKRLPGFDIYDRKLFSVAEPPLSPIAYFPSNSPNHLFYPSLNEPNLEPLDPTSGYHPLLSMYYLAREKLERERVSDSGQFTNSQLSQDLRRRAEETQQKELEARQRMRRSMLI